MPELHLVVVTNPVAKARPRIAVRGGKPHGYTPTKTANAEWRIRSAFLERYPGYQPLTGPLVLDLVARLKMPASIAKRDRDTAWPTTRPDCDNYLKTVLDALNGVAFVDDSQVVSVIMTKRYAGGLPPSWEITLREIVTPMAQPAATPGDSAHGSRDAGLRRKVG